MVCLHISSVLGVLDYLGLLGVLSMLVVLSVLGVLVDLSVLGGMMGVSGVLGVVGALGVLSLLMIQKMFVNMKYVMCDICGKFCHRLVCLLFTMTVKNSVDQHGGGKIPRPA